MCLGREWQHKTDWRLMIYKKKKNDMMIQDKQWWQYEIITMAMNMSCKWKTQNSQNMNNL